MLRKEYVCNIFLHVGDIPIGHRHHHMPDCGVGHRYVMLEARKWAILENHNRCDTAILETVALVFELISSEFIFIGRTRFRLNLGSLGSIQFATFKIKNYNADCSFFYIFTSWHRHEFKIMFLIIIIYTWRYSWWFKLSFKMTLLI